MKVNKAMMVNGYKLEPYADLRGADLRKGMLMDVNLVGANMADADLRGAHMLCADLRGADLRRADLRCAYLRRAILRNAILEGAKLDGAALPLVGNKKEIRSMQLDKYDIAFTKYTLRIGCKQHSIGEWKNFTDDEIATMDDGALEWWKKWKDFIFQAIELSFGG